VAEALADELDTDEFAAKFTKSFFFNRARPDLVIFRKDLDREEAKRLERDFVDKNRGFWRAFNPYLMPGELQIKELAANLRNIGLANLRAFERDMIVQVWGVPPEVFGILSSSTRALITASSFPYAMWVLIPRLDFQRETLQARLVPEYDPRLILDYVSPVMEDEEFVLEVGKAAPWSLSVDEWRELAERNSLGEELSGDLRPIPFNIEFGNVVDARMEGEENGLLGGLKQKGGSLKVLTFEEESFIAIHRIARRLEPRMRDAFLDAADRMRESMGFRSGVESALISL